MEFDLDGMLFDWLEDKAAENLEEHGVSFEEAAEVFFDRQVLRIPDLRHSTPFEKRWTAIGLAFGGDVLRVTYKHLEGGKIHIISARMASPREENLYDQRR
jgi:uncharacterized protein